MPYWGFKYRGKCAFSWRRKCVFCNLFLDLFLPFLQSESKVMRNQKELLMSNAFARVPPPPPLFFLYISTVPNALFLRISALV